MEYRCFIFSLDKEKERSFAFNSNSIPQETQDKAPMSKKQLLTMCRELLYDTYIREQEWVPPSHSGTSFSIRKDENTSWMLCDRYDEYSSYWITILDQKDNLAACSRLLYKDYDVLNYGNFPFVIRKALTNNSWMMPSAEAQRATVSPQHRNSNLFLYIYYFSCLFASNGLNCRSIFTTQSLDYMISFSKDVGLENPPGWSFRYTTKDPISYILYGNPNTVVYNILKRLTAKL